MNDLLLTAVENYKTAIREEEQADRDHTAAVTIMRRATSKLADATEAKNNALLKVNALVEEIGHER